MSYFVFTVSSWHESSRPEVLCISGAVNWLPPSSASGGRSSDNVGCRPGGSIRHPPELIILWITDKLLKKKEEEKTDLDLINVCWHAVESTRHFNPKFSVKPHIYSYLLTCIKVTGSCGVVLTWWTHWRPVFERAISPHGEWFLTVQWILL